MIEVRDPLPDDASRTIRVSSRRKTKNQLVEEITMLRRRVTELEAWEKQWRQSKREAQKVNARLSAILQAFDGLIYVCTQDFRVEFMNAKLIERTGYDATGQLCYQVLHGRRSVCPWCVNERVFKGETVRWEIQSPKDGQWFYVVNAPLYNQDGTISKQSVMMDITERKRAEEALRRAHADLEQAVAERTGELLTRNRQLSRAIEEYRRTEAALRQSEAKYRGLVDNIGIGIALISPRMEILTLNEQMKRWFPDIAVGQQPICYQAFNKPPRQSVCSYCPTYQTLQDGQVHESVTQTPDGNRTRHYKIISSPIRDSAGNVAAAIEMVEDISGKIEMQARLKDSENRYRTIFETTASATMIVEEDTTIALVNTEFEKLSGYAKTEIEGRRSWKEFVVPDDLERMQAYHRQRRADPDAAPRNYEFRVQSKNGGVRDVFTTVAMLPGTKQSAVSLLDITNRKRAQLALQASEKQLRNFSSRLQAAQEDERKRISRDLHDSIGQSLMVIKLQVENALKSVQAGKRNAQIVAKTLQSLLPAIQNCVAETRRICSGLRPSMLDDIGVIATIGWFCRNFHITFPSLLIKRAIEVDEHQIREPLKIVIFRILQEAFNNVTKYSQASVVKIGLVKCDDRIELSISDNGCGFDLEAVMAGNDRDRGLGISGMRERAELSGGRFTIASTRGRGTEVKASWSCQGTEHADTLQG
jgi:PAS domain S-box-containing protein